MSDQSSAALLATTTAVSGKWNGSLRAHLAAHLGGGHGESSVLETPAAGCCYGASRSVTTDGAGKFIFGTGTRLQVTLGR